MRRMHAHNQLVPIDILSVGYTLISTFLPARAELSRNLVAAKGVVLGCSSFRDSAFTGHCGCSRSGYFLPCLQDY